MAGPLGVMIYVANNDSNELIYTTSKDGVNWLPIQKWSPGSRIGQSTKFPPALIPYYWHGRYSYGDSLLLVSVDNDGTDHLVYRTASNAEQWGVDSTPIAWYYQPLAGGLFKRLGKWASSKTGPALVSHGVDVYVYYAPDGDELWCWHGTAAGAWSEVTFGREDRRLSFKSRGRPAVAIVNDKFAIAYNDPDTDNLVFRTSDKADVWTSPPVLIATTGVDPTIAVLNNEPFVAFRYRGNHDRLAVANIRQHRIVTFADMKELSKHAPALTTLNNKLVLAFVAANDTNDLLVSTSTDGVNWSPNQRIGHTSKMAPALATFHG